MLPQMLKNIDIVYEKEEADDAKKNEPCKEFNQLCPVDKITNPNTANGKIISCCRS